MHLRQVQLVFHRASSVLEDNASQHPVQSPGVVDVSPSDLGVLKGQKIWSLAKGGGFDVVSVCPDKQAFCQTALLTETSSGKELSSPVKCFPQTLIVFNTTR